MSCSLLRISDIKPPLVLDEEGVSIRVAWFTACSKTTKDFVVYEKSFPGASPHPGICGVSGGDTQALAAFLFVLD